VCLASAIRPALRWGGLPNEFRNPGLPTPVVGGFFLSVLMTPSEIQQILQHVDAALDVYRKNEGKLSVAEVRMKSLLNVLRGEVADQVDVSRKLTTSRE
jgi:hypothetical protein